MAREGDFSSATKKAALERQGGLCAFCGLALSTPWSQGPYKGQAHHLRPLHHGGSAELDNCVYLCWEHHLLLGHGMTRAGLDGQGGSSDSWVQLDREDFEFWVAGDEA